MTDSHDENLELALIHPVYDPPLTGTPGPQTLERDLQGFSAGRVIDEAFDCGPHLGSDSGIELPDCFGRRLCVVNPHFSPMTCCGPRYAAPSRAFFDVLSST